LSHRARLGGLTFSQNYDIIEVNKMGWNSFTPLEKDLDNNILHTLFTYDLLGDKVITAQCTKVVTF
jgi:hypothetical protein